MAWVDLGVVQAYQSSADLPDLDTSRRRAMVLDRTGQLFGPLNGEAANVSVTLTDPQLMIQLLSNPPLSATLHYRDKQGRLHSFEGSTGITVGASIEIQINA